MKTRILSALVIVGGLALLLMLATAAQGTTKPVVAPSSPPTPLPIEVAPPVHIPYNPFLRSDTLPEYPYNKLRPSGLRPQPAPTKPAGIDLDVTYISRWPMYNHYTDEDSDTNLDTHGNFDSYTNYRAWLH